MSEHTITPEQQAAIVMLKTLAAIAEGGMDAGDAAAFALQGIKTADEVRRDGEPLHGLDTAGRDDGERMGQPPGVLYTLTITDTGDANEWRSDRVQTAEQTAWLHGIVMAAAAQLAGGAGGSALN